MTLLAIILLAISLNMDALGIGISYGLRGTKTSWPAKIIIMIISIVITGSAIFLGGIITQFLDPLVSKIIGCTMLMFLGALIIIKASLEKKEDKTKESLNIIDENIKLQEKKSSKKNKDSSKTIFEMPLLGFTIKLIKQGPKIDYENIKYISIKEAFYIGAALSIDAFGAGLSTAVSGLNSFLIPIFVAIFQFIFLEIGAFIGKKIFSSNFINPHIFVILSGVLLIILAFLRIYC